MRMLRLQLLALLLVGLLLALISADPVPQDTEVAREKRGTITLDFGLLLRNLLLKSAQLSSAKANLARTTRRPPTTTTTTPPPPPPPAPIRIRKPIWHPFFSSGFLPGAFDVDYADPPAPRPPEPPPPTTQPPRRVRPDCDHVVRLCSSSSLYSISTSQTLKAEHTSSTDGIPGSG
ncbi:GD14835 [Drosophila simulans]|uniref:GD14835 n=1 Tax=Drosophila simulans TaxID=7240 RepID=B4QRC5_DROSI|nr:GD14835 [Drosophila simulans]